MKESLTPEKIQEDLTIGDLSKENAAELLISLIERSDNTKIRVASIKALEKIEFQSEKIFKTIENCLISDENADIRASVAKHIIDYFPEEGFPALRWAILHDSSPLVLKVFFDSMEKFENLQLKPIKKDLSNWNEQYASKIGIVPEESRFFLDLEVLFAKGKRNYEIDPQGYKYFKNLSDIKNGEPWLVIKNKHVEILNFNYFNWKWVKENSDIVNSLHKLKHLDIYFNSINEYNFKSKQTLKIPETIGKLKYLKKLILKRNNIQYLPESIRELAFLKELDISHNKLQEIPQSIKYLKKLQKINLKHNKVKEIPDSLMLFLKSLKSFKI